MLDLSTCVRQLKNEHEQLLAKEMCCKSQMSAEIAVHSHGCAAY